jgi:hypothetical protein
MSTEASAAAVAQQKIGGIAAATKCGIRLPPAGLGGEIAQNRTVARPKRFELLTPRFVV